MYSSLEYSAEITNLQSMPDEKVFETLATIEASMPKGSLNNKMCSTTGLTICLIIYYYLTIMDKWLIKIPTNNSASPSQPTWSASNPTSTKTKKRKYDESYLQHGFTCSSHNNEEQPVCLICKEVLAEKSMKTILSVFCKHQIKKRTLWRSMLL
ncbi:hypothetical protein WA026_021783 [Henosepilachna vigintioctopunctata]|uniref:Uncharacterized protein n=1 Tax=Henosepilachna vigintioctopunctata TaxID=420089 RepID=A0AAW1TY61_9CUCU